MVFLGIDWAEAHHDVCLLDEQGKVLGKRRVVDGLEGVRRLHELVAEHASEPEQVVVGIETDRGLLVQALLAASYQIYAINPLAVSRYSEGIETSGAKPDAADAVLRLLEIDGPSRRPARRVLPGVFGTLRRRPDRCRGHRHPGAGADCL